MGSDRLKALYPMVDESETPLPRCWSTKDKFTSIGLSQGNLRVHYKGQTHKDAASVRATKPIPAACGLYYFEVKIINKGRDGYMGVGLSVQGVSMNRLPGWDKYSYGYHGDDGHSFCSSGSGQPYGPTFTTGDVVGCAVNLIDNTCYYTKNGINLGVAFTDLPKNLYPTVGLQTPGEVVDGNFGQSPFVYDIENDMRELRMRTVSTIDKYLIPDKYMHQSVMHKMVQSFLVHHGFSATAEAFARATGQEFVEDLISIRNRQRIQRLVLAGRVSEAIETTQNLYPGIFERDLNLLFRLKVRQFIEMVAGADAEVKGSRSPKSQFDSPSMSPSYGSTFSSHSSSSGLNPSHVRRSRSRSNSPTVHSHTSVIQSTRFANGRTSVQPVAELDGELDVQSARTFSNGSSTRVIAEGGDTDVDMEAQSNKLSSNGVHNGSSHNGAGISTELAMDVDGLAPIGRQLCGGSSTAIEKTLAFGRELKTLGDQMKEKYGKNEANKKMMSDAFSLIAYQDPWSSKVVGWQLDRSQREQLCDLLNSAIVETHRMPGRPPLELALAHGTELGNLMAQSDLGLCAFVSVKSILEAPDQ